MVPTLSNNFHSILIIDDSYVFYEHALAIRLNSLHLKHKNLFSNSVGKSISIRYIYRNEHFVDVVFLQVECLDYNISSCFS